MLSVLWLLACEGTPTEAPTASAPAPVAPAPPAAPTRKVAFAQPLDGATVTSPVTVSMLVEGMEVRRAGDMTDNSGHHHVLIDLGPVPEGQTIPKDTTHLHYGGAETEAQVELTPGPHILTLQFADANHSSYGPAMSQTIAVTVR